MRRWKELEFVTAHYLEAHSLSISSPDDSGHYTASPISTKSIKAHWSWPILPYRSSLTEIHASQDAIPRNKTSINNQRCRNKMKKFLGSRDCCELCWYLWFHAHKSLGIFQHPCCSRTPPGSGGVPLCNQFHGWNLNTYNLNKIKLNWWVTRSFGKNVFLTISPACSFFATIISTL